MRCDDDILAAMKKQLIVGASGQVGLHLFNAVKESGVTPVGTSHSQSVAGLHSLDVRDADAVNKLIETSSPEVIYIASALTNVDYCESHPDESYDLNVRGCHNVVLAARTVKARVIYLSTDYVFDGTNGPYSEDDAPNPINVYGIHKLLAEHCVCTMASSYVIARTTGVFGPDIQRKNFINRLEDSMKKGIEVKVPSDQYSTPTYAPNLAQALCEAAYRADFNGVLNLSGTEYVSRYDLAKTAAEVVNFDGSRIVPLTTAELNQTAKRPLSGGLRTDRASKLLKTELISFRDGLKEMAQVKL